MEFRKSVSPLPSEHTLMNCECDSCGILYKGEWITWDEYYRRGRIKMRAHKKTKEFEDFCNEILHAISLKHDKICKKKSCGYCNTEDCKCDGMGDTCSCNLCQAIFEVETKQKTYRSYSQVMEIFLEFPTFGFFKTEYNSCDDWEEFTEQFISQIKFLNSVKKIFLRHLRTRYSN